jgi:hypothetical protein
MAKKDLSPKQVKALLVLSVGQSQERAAKEAGVQTKTVNLWLKEERFREELRLTMERMRHQFESRVMSVANNAMVVVQELLTHKEPLLRLKGAQLALNSATRLSTRYKELQVEGYVPPPAPMIVITDGMKDPIFNPSTPTKQLEAVIDAEAKEIDGDPEPSDT